MSGWLAVIIYLKGGVSVGGIGSGRYGTWGESRMTRVDECFSLDVSTIRREGRFVSCDWFPEESDRTPHLFKKIRVISGSRQSLHLKLQFWDSAAPEREPKAVETEIKLSWTACNYGGCRPWFLCPADNCGKRVRVLYCPPDEIDLRCRECCRLSYRSRHRSGDESFRLRNKYHWVQHRLNRRGLPFQILGDVPHRPKGMHRKTYLSLLLEQFKAMVLIEQAEACRLDRENREAQNLLKLMGVRPD